MKSSISFLNKYAIQLILIVLVLVSFFLNIYLNQVICLNADEAAFSYNAYSLLKTGRDEYGSVMPLRLTSFGDNKLPVLSYAMMPFIALFGLDTWVVRLPTMIAGSILPLLFYLLGMKLFHDKRTALLAASLSAVSLGIHIFSRQAFEGVIAIAFIMLSLLVALNYLNRRRYTDMLVFALFVGLSLFTYHLAKVIVTVILIWFGWQILKKGLRTFSKTHLLILLVPLILFTISEITYPASRVSNLLFYKTPGFVQRIEEMRREHDVRFLHNKGTQSILTLSENYMTYFSPQFLVMEGDSDPRFGFTGMSPITPLTYIFLFIGFSFMYHRKEKYRYLLTILFLASPVSAALTWLDPSLKRSLFIFVPTYLIAAYGFIHFLSSLQTKYRLPVALALIFSYLFFLMFSWDFYYHHYPKRPLVSAALQCGYEEVHTYIKENYDTTDRFYITKKHGQPYIFTLFYLSFPPHIYQQQATLSAPDEYGFGQVEQFDKFAYTFPSPAELIEGNVSFIGYPDDFNNSGITREQVTTIMQNGTEQFWIYEPPKKK